MKKLTSTEISFLARILEWKVKDMDMKGTETSFGLHRAFVQEMMSNFRAEENKNKAREDRDFIKVIKVMDKIAYLYHSYSKMGISTERKKKIEREADAMNDKYKHGFKRLRESAQYIEFFKAARDYVTKYFEGHEIAVMRAIVFSPTTKHYLKGKVKITDFKTRSDKKYGPKYEVEFYEK